ncbi:MAG: M20 family metallopeptidase [Clostridiaceae bacterium]|nr:M20 family metallopeptidase [Clostridiaceae bacterium]
MNRLNEALELLGKMVAIPSVEGAEKEMGDFLSEYTASLGMTVEKQIVEENRSNIIARVQIGKGGKTVLLNSHMDVVPPGDGWDTNPYELVVKGDKAYGRGSTDAKGALTAFLMATKNIIENPDGLNGNIIFTAVVDEESYSKGARYMAEHRSVEADYGIVGEPTMSNVYIWHKGSIRPVIKIKGRSAHASTPELGISAVRVASYISNLVDEIQDKLYANRHPIAGSSSISITMLKAGIKENVLPDTCEMTIDRRMIPGEDEKETIESFEKICRDAEKKFPGASVKIDRYIMTTGPASEVKPDSEIAKLAYAACEEVTGIKQAPNGTDCNTDMNHFIRMGIPCVIIGPGTLKVAHMPNEYVELKQLELAYKVHENVIRSLLR